MKTPKISILCPSYNHEKYVKYFIESVLAQTEQNFELIIIDDFSSDNNIQEIEKFNDPRIKLIKHTFNQGINVSLEEGINIAEAEIIALVASDDVLKENYIEEVIKIFEQNKQIGVTYVSFECIDFNNNKIENSDRVFYPRPRFEILKESFIKENQLPSPGMAFKKTAVIDFLPLPKGLIQYHDWDLHNKLLTNNEIFITDSRLLEYRVSANSTSARSNVVLSREAYETDLMMNYFLEIKDIDLFKLIFKGCYEPYGEPLEATIPYFLSRIALNSPIQRKKEWGYKTLIKFISVGNNLQLLHELYNIDYAAIMKLCPILENNSILNNKYQKKYKKYKKCFNITLLIFIFVILILLFINGGLNG